jgi:hypothetical protein
VPKILTIQLPDQSAEPRRHASSEASTSRLAIVLSFPNVPDGGFNTITRSITLSDQVSVYEE